MDNNINIKYQNITKEKLDAYWKNKPEEDFTETVIRVPLVLLCKLAILCSTGRAWQSYIWPYLSIQKETIRPALLAQYFAVALLITLAVWVLLFVMVKILSHKIFHNYDIRSRYLMAKIDLGWAKSIFYLQALLKEKNVKEISCHDSDHLKIVYVCKNGISEEYTAYIGTYYDNVVKEDCLDFTWMDDEINKILIKNKLPKIEN